MKLDTNGTFDKPGKISIPFYLTSDSPYEPGSTPRAYLEEVLEIEVTQRELLEAGLIPEDLGWTEAGKKVSLEKFLKLRHNPR